jgi:multiple sugar transport system ATP-binding protein
MVFVTHDQVEAMTMADRIVVLRDGVIEQIGRPLELYDRPANPFVAGFIGSPSMNLFKGRVVGEGEARFEGPDGLELPLAPYAGAWDGSALTLGVRPEHLDIVPPGTPGAIEADVSLVEPTGSETMIVARRGKTEIIVSTRNRPTVDSGDRIALRAEPDLLHLFWPEGRRIDPLTA